MPTLQLATATDLELWAERLEARSLLPKLLRRLTFVSAQRLEFFDFRADEGVGFPGFDGITRAQQSSTFVPDGEVVWEMGASADPRRKAQDDYETRSNGIALNGTKRNDATFIFVTPRRWSGKNDWAEQKRAEGIWRDVRVYDGDNLETWLEAYPSVHYWLSQLIGKTVSGADDLQTWWENWSQMTTPAINPDLVLAGRTEAVEKLGTWLQVSPTALFVKGDTLDETVAFIAATFQKMSPELQENLFAKSMVVYDAQTWTHLTKVDNSLILIPMFAERSVIAPSVTSKHHVLVPSLRTEPELPGSFSLPRLRREPAKEALTAMGLSDTRTYDLATLARRGLGALRRELANNPMLLIPKWATLEAARLLIPATLLGQWRDNNSGDQEVITKLTGQSYAQAREEFVRWSLEADPPLRFVNGSWLVVSKKDMWSMLARFITRTDLEKFEEVALSALGEEDPKFELPNEHRWKASIFGKELSHSGLLREGLADTLALMAAFSDVYPLSNGFIAKDWATRIVRKLLTDGITWQRWASLSMNLRSLAEAAPTTFLTAVDESLSGDEPMLIKLFTDNEHDLMSSSPHSGLLWALELLAWSPDYLAASTLALAKLARLEPGGKTLNRPGKSLHEIFLPWHPSTTASVKQRLRVLSTLRRREPMLAQSLLLSLLPQRFGMALPTSEPKWRDWVPDEKVAVSYADYFTFTGEIVKYLLEDAGFNGELWKKLIDVIDDLPRPDAEAIISRLSVITLGNFSIEDRNEIWACLREFIFRHLEFRDADWALPDDVTAQLNTIYEHFTPNDPVTQRAWIFDNRVELPETRDLNYEERGKVIAGKRSQAIEELLAIGGIDLVLPMAETVDNPWSVGFTLGQSYTLRGQELQVLSKVLGVTAEKSRNLGLGFLHGVINRQGLDWAKTVRTNEVWQTWSPPQKADYFLCLPFSKEVWQLVEESGEEVTQSYWVQAGMYGHIMNEGDHALAIEKFMANGRLHTAIDFMAMYARGDAKFSGKMIAATLEKVVT